MKKEIKIAVQIALVGIIVLFACLIVACIQHPIEFEKKQEKRFDMAINRLKDIRTAQVAYKSLHNEYTPSFDTLIKFIKTDSMRVVNKEGFVPDTLTEKKAVELGIVKRDTIKMPLMDTLFANINYPIDSLGHIPCGTHAPFRMDTATVMTGSKVAVKVFEARVSNWDVLDGLDEQLIINYNAEKDSVLRVGSLTEATNNAGNWE